MAEQNESIEELKQVVSFLADTGEAASRIQADGKVESKEITEEGLGLLMKSGKLMGVGKAIEQRKLLSNPLKRQELIEFFKKDFDIENDDVEEFVEGSISLLDKLFEVGQLGLKLRNKNTEV